MKRPWHWSLLLVLGLPLTSLAARASAECPAALALRPLELQGPRPPAPVADPGGADYRHQLHATPTGWPVRDHWCIWIEPMQAAAGSAAAERELRWQRAVKAALEPWSELLSLSTASEADQAQVRIWRRRPPLQRLANGRTRASNGRALLELVLVDRGRGWQAEPRVEVLLDPGRAPLALQATALHELGHAFGLWGHSDAAADAMAEVPGRAPVLQLSRRDRATLRWLLSQPQRLQIPPGPAQTPTAERSPQPDPRAD